MPKNNILHNHAELVDSNANEFSHSVVELVSYSIVSKVKKLS